MTLREAPDSAHRSGFPPSDAESAGRRSVENLSVDEVRDSRLLEPECCRSRILRSWTGQWKSHWNIRFQREWRSRYRAPSGSLRRVPGLVPAATSAGRNLELRLPRACGLTRIPGLGTIPLGTGTRLGMRPGSGDCERGPGGCGMATRHVLKRRRLAQLAPSVASELRQYRNGNTSPAHCARRKGEQVPRIRPWDGRISDEPRADGTICNETRRQAHAKGCRPPLSGGLPTHGLASEAGTRGTLAPHRVDASVATSQRETQCLSPRLYRVPGA